MIKVGSNNLFFLLFCVISSSMWPADEEMYALGGSPKKYPVEQFAATQKHPVGEVKNSLLFAQEHKYGETYVAELLADKKVHQDMVDEVRQFYPELPESKVADFAKRRFHDFKKHPDDPRHKWHANTHALKVAEVKKDLFPSKWNSLVYGAQKNVVQPVVMAHAEHASEINALGRILVIGSAAAYIFNKMGGTEWMRNKIKEAFARPKIYTIQRRKTGLFASSGDKLIKVDDLVLAPKTKKQVEELIWLTRRRYEELKITKKTPPPFDHVLLYGPPGTGKTSIARMIADQSLGDDGQPMYFIQLMASEFMRIKNEGDRITTLKEMFQEARRLRNCIIFLDEIDGMVAQRGKETENNRAFLDHLLDEMATPSTAYFVIAATNHINKIDNALLSRFRRKMQVGLPTTQQRKQMLDKKIDQELIKKGYTSTLNTQQLAIELSGDAGRDIEAFVARIRDRLDYERNTEATQELAYDILREMGKTPALPEEDDESA